MLLSRCALAGSLAAFLCACVVAQDGLLLHYTFDEGEGDIATDASGNGNDGKIHQATYVPSPRGHALHFDGVDDHVVAPGRESLSVSGDMTIEVWLRAERTDERAPPDSRQQREFVF